MSEIQPSSVFQFNRKTEADKSLDDLISIVVFQHYNTKGVRNNIPKSSWIVEQTAKTVKSNLLNKLTILEKLKHTIIMIPEVSTWENAHKITLEDWNLKLKQ